jgi:hypothetical protein
MMMKGMQRANALSLTSSEGVCPEKYATNRQFYSYQLGQKHPGRRGGRA